MFITVCLSHRLQIEVQGDICYAMTVLLLKLFAIVSSSIRSNDPRIAAWAARYFKKQREESVSRRRSGVQKSEGGYEAVALLRLKSTAAGHEAVRGLAAGTAAAAAAAAAAATARGGASVALTAVFTATAVAVLVAPSATAAAKAATAATQAATAAAKGRLADAVSDVCI